MSLNVSLKHRCRLSRVFLCSCSGGCCSEAEHKLFSVIFSNYNQYIRPVENVTDPVIVQFEVSMSQLVKVVSGPACFARPERWFYVLLKPKIKHKDSGFEQKSFRITKLPWAGGVGPPGSDWSC